MSHFTRRGSRGDTHNYGSVPGGSPLRGVSIPGQRDANVNDSPDAYHWPASFHEGMDYLSGSLPNTSGFPAHFRTASPLMVDTSEGIPEEYKPMAQYTPRQSLLGEEAEQTFFARLETIEKVTADLALRGQGRSSFLQTTFNCINTVLGVGVLSLPFAFKCSGWVLGLSLLVVLLLVTNYTGKLLRRCLIYHPGIRSFPDIGEMAFGLAGRYGISFFFLIELFTACVMYLILAADNLVILCPRFEHWQWVLLTTAIVLPTASTSHLHYLSYMSVVGIVSSLFLLGVTLYMGLSTPVSPGSLHEPMPTRLWPETFASSLITYGLIMVGFAGHACLPSIYESMRHPRQYDAMLDCTWLLVGAAYLGIAAVGYLMYGDMTMDEITKNFSTASAVGTVAVALIAVNPITKFGLTLNPVALSVEEFTEIYFQKHRTRQLVNLIVRWGLTGLTAVVAVTVPHFARVVGFIGAFFSFSVSIIFPCVCYLRFYWPELGWGVISFNILLCVLAAVCAVFGTMGAVFSDIG